MPPGPCIGIVRCQFSDKDRRPDCERAVNDVTVTGDPARICGAPVNVIVLDVEDIFARVIRSYHVSRTGMDDPLGLSRRSARVQDEKRVLGIHRFERAIVRHSFHHLVEIQLDGFLEIDIRLSPAEDDNMFDCRGVDDRFFNDCLQLDCFPPPYRYICSDDHFRLGVVDPHVEGRRPESAENNAMNRPDPCTCQHGNDLFRDKGHINAYPVSFPDSKLLEAVRKAADLDQELLVGEDPFPSLISLPDQGNLVAACIVYVTVKTVCSDIQTGVGEPPGVRILPVENSVPWADP